jgi:hypothetical protein
VATKAAAAAAAATTGAAAAGGGGFGGGGFCGNGFGGFGLGGGGFMSVRTPLAPVEDFGPVGPVRWAAAARVAAAQAAAAPGGPDELATGQECEEKRRAWFASASAAAAAARAAAGGGGGGGHVSGTRQGGVPPPPTSQQVRPKGSTRLLLPSSVAVLRAWLRDHVAHPYPNAAEKEELMASAGVTPVQLRNWFTNARARELGPVKLGDPVGAGFTRALHAHGISGASASALRAWAEEHPGSFPDAQEEAALVLAAGVTRQQVGWFFRELVRRMQLDDVAAGAGEEEEGEEAAGAGEPAAAEALLSPYGENAAAAAAATAASQLPPCPPVSIATEAPWVMLPVLAAPPRVPPPPQPPPPHAAPRAGPRADSASRLGMCVELGFTQADMDGAREPFWLCSDKLLEYLRARGLQQAGGAGGKTCGHVLGVRGAAAALFCVCE